MDNAEMLLEQMKQLEQDLSGLTAEEEKRAGNSASEVENKEVPGDKNLVYNSEEDVGQEIREVDKLEFSKETRKKDRDKIVNQFKPQEDDSEFERQTHRVSGSEKTQEARFALAVQLERTDKIAFASARTAWDGKEQRGREGGYPLALSGSWAEGQDSQLAGTADVTPGVSSGGLEVQSAPGRDLLWAEQADRAFRRDSRRYDGVFYLY